MMATSIACGPCDVRAKSSPAEYWCHECDDLLCEECSSHHSAAKSSRGHTVISVDEYKTLPESVRKISSLCPDHGLKYYHFCAGHKSLCCPVCAQSTHKSCPDLKLLDEVTKTAKTSSFIEEVETSMKNIKFNLEKILSDRGQNISSLRKQKQEIKEKIGTVRKQVHQHIDSLEEKIQNELSRLEESEIKKLELSISKLTTSLDMIKNKLEETAMLKTYASDLQTFLGTRELEIVIEKEKVCLENSFQGGSLNVCELQCSIHDKIQAIMSDITTFGSISVISKPSAARLTTDKDKQAQIFLSTPKQNRIKFEDATAQSKSKFSIQGSEWLKGCSVLPDDKVAVADDGNKRIIILTESGTIVKNVPIREIEYGPYDVTLIDDRLFALSSNKGAQIIDVDTGTVDKTFDVGQCHGLSYYDRMLYCCVVNKGVISIEMSTGRSKTIIQDRHKNLSYCVVTGGNLYYTRSDKKGLQCYSIKGEKKWEYEDTTLIDYPLGVTVDGSGNVYLASYNNFQILMISPDGQRCRQILSGNDGIKVPWGLSYNKNKNELFVACFGGQCFLYKIN